MATQTTITVPEITEVSLSLTQERSQENIVLSSEDIETIETQVSDIRESITEIAKAISDFNGKVFNADVWTDENAAEMLKEHNDELKTTLDDNAETFDALAKEIGEWQAHYEEVNKQAADKAVNG